MDRAVFSSEAMVIQEIESAFRAKVADRVRLEPEGINRFRVLNPFVFDDGDHLSIVLKREGDSWLLSDEGNTFMRLTYRLEERSLASGTRQNIISDALEMFGIDDRKGELVITVPGEAFGDALYSFVQGVLRISDVALLSRERVQSAFMEDFRSFMAESLPSDLFSLEWHHPTLDPEGMYEVDCYINGKVAPTAILALPGDAKVRDATITLLKFEQWGVPLRTVAVFEDQEAIGRSVLARFSDVCDKQFSSLSANKDRLRLYLSGLVKAAGIGDN